MTASADHEPPSRVDAIAREVLSALDGRSQIEPFTGRPASLDLHVAYEVAAAVRRMREARGERVVGRKIGFTNRTIWAEYGVHAPIWGEVYDTTLRSLSDLHGPHDLSNLVEPRIEPEIALGLARAPEPSMDERALLSCVEWVAHGFELVQSLFPGWRFRAADTVAAFGLHGALLLGPQQRVAAADHEAWLGSLAAFEITLSCDGRVADRGRAANVLGGGPLAALRHLVEELAAQPGSPLLAAGEVVTTGTLTRALPVEPGQTWSTSLTDVPLAGIALSLA